MSLFSRIRYGLIVHVKSSSRQPSSRLNSIPEFLAFRRMGSGGAVNFDSSGMKSWSGLRNVLQTIDKNVSRPMKLKVLSNETVEFGMPFPNTLNLEVSFSAVCSDCDVSFEELWKGNSDSSLVLLSVDSIDDIPNSILSFMSNILLFTSVIISPSMDWCFGGWNRTLLLDVKQSVTVSDPHFVGEYCCYSPNHSRKDFVEKWDGDVCGEGGVIDIGGLMRHIMYQIGAGKKFGA